MLVVGAGLIILSEFFPAYGTPTSLFLYGEPHQLVRPTCGLSVLGSTRFFLAS